MSFALEVDMIPVIKSKYNTFVHEQTINPVAFAEELPVNYRIVDLLFAPIQINIEALNNPLYKNALKKLSMQQLDVLSIFMTNHKGISIQRVSKILRMEPDKVREIYLERFLELELIRRDSRYTYSSTDWVEVNPLYVVAIEAKLNKWKDALEQGIYNHKFADYSYVALDGSFNLKQSIVDKFIEANVGLISVSTENSISIVFEPNRNQSYRQSDFRLQRLRLCRDLICKNSKWSLI